MSHGHPTVKGACLRAPARLSNDRRS
jgi:hypothetical protein